MDGVFWTISWFAGVDVPNVDEARRVCVTRLAVLAGFAFFTAVAELLSFTWTTVTGPRGFGAEAAPSWRSLLVSHGWRNDTPATASATATAAASAVQRNRGRRGRRGVGTRVGADGRPDRAKPSSFAQNATPP